MGHEMVDTLQGKYKLSEVLKAALFAKAYPYVLLSVS